MSVHPVSRAVSGSTVHNTINIPTVRIFFQKSPGKPSSDARGIVGLECRILHDGVAVRSVATAKNGLIEVPLSNNVATLQVLDKGEPVVEYEIARDDAPFDPVDTLLGQQQRLRHLGYQLGHGGPDEDGVSASAILNVSPFPRTPDDPEDDEDDIALRERQKRERKENPDIKEELFTAFTFQTERSILDFQVDAGLFVDARVGPKTRAKLTAAVGE